MEEYPLLRRIRCKPPDGIYHAILGCSCNADHATGIGINGLQVPFTIDPVIPREGNRTHLNPDHITGLLK